MATRPKRNRSRPPKPGADPATGITPGASVAGPWQHPHHVTERRISDNLFLINEDTDSIYHLNGLADALWRLTAEPVTETEMVDLVTAAFPKVGRTRIVDDVATLLNSLMTRGLLRRRQD
jgi:hypothetical protein